MPHESRRALGPRPRAMQRVGDARGGGTSAAPRPPSIVRRAFGIVRLPADRVLFVASCDNIRPPASERVFAKGFPSPNAEPLQPWKQVI